MALKKTLAERLFKISKISSQCVTNCRVSSSAPTRILQNSPKTNIAPDPGDSGMFRRLFHKRALFQPDLRPIQIGENLMEKLRAFDITRDRIRLDCLSPPVTLPMERSPEKDVLTVEDARKLLRVAQLEMVKTRLRDMDQTWISYSEFVRICGEGCSDPEQRIRVAKTLDESGTVIVLGNAVCLKPEQVKLKFTILFRFKLIKIEYFYLLLINFFYRFKH